MQPRPIALVIFGILNIGFGGYNFISVFFLQAMADSAKAGADSSFKTLLWITGGMSAAAGIVLAAAGVGLLLLKNWARIVSMAWAGLYILLAVAQIPLSWQIAKALAPTQFGAGISQLMATVVTVVSLLLNLAYPAALLIFMRRPKIVAACNGQAGT